MHRQGSGAIVNIGSGAGLLGVPGHSGYVASKHAGIGLTRSAALEYAAEGIRVNAVAPGLVDTPLIHNSAGELYDYIQPLIASHPIGRIARPEAIADQWPAPRARCQFRPRGFVGLGGHRPRSGRPRLGFCSSARCGAAGGSRRCECLPGHSSRVPNSCSQMERSLSFPNHDSMKAWLSGVPVAAAAVRDPDRGEDELERSGGERGSVVGAQRQHARRDRSLGGCRFDQGDRLGGAGSELEVPAGVAAQDGVAGVAASAHRSRSPILVERPLCSSACPTPRSRLSRCSRLVILRSSMRACPSQGCRGGPAGRHLVSRVRRCG